MRRYTVVERSWYFRCRNLAHRVVSHRDAPLCTVSAVALVMRRWVRRPHSVDLLELAATEGWREGQRQEILVTEAQADIQAEVQAEA